MPNISADPYAWPYNGDLRPENYGPDNNRYADRLLWAGWLR